MSDESSPFSQDYASARARFRQAAAQLNWSLESYPIETRGPGGEELTVDAAISDDGSTEPTLLLTSGLHGIEGYFGSAVQVQLMRRWATGPRPPARCIFLHGLNPYGFAWRRRFDENNVDPNRNFLPPEESYRGAPDAYQQLDSLLNPRHPPSRWEPFRLKAICKVAQQGMPALRRAIAEGQYEYPQGLFFGGHGPSTTHRLLAEHWDQWMEGRNRVIHLDLHTGLGAKGSWKLLIDYPLSASQRDWLTEQFGPAAFEEGSTSSIAYQPRGGMGPWCMRQAKSKGTDYVYTCAEFGTYGPIKMLTGLRRENQAHHWGEPSSASTLLAKQHLRELFCPSSESWRQQVLEASHRLVEQALA